MNEIRVSNDFTLLNDAFLVYQNIPEFQNQRETSDVWIERLKSNQHPLFIVSYVDNRPVGMLIGYERYAGFYIWLAGVLPEYRRQAIFTGLLQQVEKWALNNHYDSLFIKTRNAFRSMLIVLIREGFNLIDMEKHDSVETHRLILMKRIQSLCH